MVLKPTTFFLIFSFSKIMAKTIAPLLSVSAHGKLGRSLVYSKKKSGLLARAMHYPKKEPSLDQWTRRHLIGLVTAHWQCMTDGERATWNANAAATDLNIPGYQYFLKSSLADLYTHHGLACYFSFNEATGEYCYCHVCDMIIGQLIPSYPDNCPTRQPSFRKEYGNCLFFDGIDDRVKIEYNSRFAITTQFTIEVWFKLAVVSSDYRTIFCNWVGAGEQRCWALYTYEDEFIFLYTTDGIETLNLRADTPISFEWTHVAVRLKPDNTLNIFLNGVKDTATKDLVSLHTYEQDLYIGSDLYGLFFYGCIDEARLYNRALTDSEIKKHYQLLRLDKKRQPLLRL